jgi:predicted nucleic acid-binding protein
LKIFIDTSAIIAYYNADDKYHEEASKVMKAIQDGSIPLTRLYISDYVFDEAMTFIKCVLHNKKMAETIGDAFQESPFTSILRVESTVFDEAWIRFKEDSGSSFTDCTSYILMDKHGINTCFTYDSHFKTAGYQTLQ